MESRHRRALLFANLVRYGNSLSVCCSPQPRHDYFSNGTYEISLESAEDISEDQVNVTKGYRKPRTKVRKILTLLTSAPLVKASPGHIPLSYLHCNLRLFILYLALSLGIVMKP
jgi:hypothetical protein